MSRVAVEDDRLGFEITSVAVDNRHRKVARFACIECAETIDVTIAPGGKMVPELLAQSARNHGWDVDAYRKNRIRCPAHTSKRRATDTDTELRRHEARMANLKPDVVPLREPTTDQRVMIRRLLEKHFDEGLGYYVEDWSDDRVAEEASVPRAVVERSREASYGPIRVSAETLAFKKQIAALRAKVNDQVTAVEQLADAVKGDAAAIRRQLDELDKRIGGTIKGAA